VLATVKDASRRAIARWPAAILDDHCARRQRRSQVGTTGWPWRSNNRMDSAIKVGDGASWQRRGCDEGWKGEKMPKRPGRNDGRGCSRTAWRLMTPHPALSTVPGPPGPTKNMFHALSRDYDPSRTPSAHGNDGFSPHAGRDRGGMTDSGGALLFAGRDGRLERRDPCNKSDFGRTDDRPEPDTGTGRK